MGSLSSFPPRRCAADCQRDEAEDIVGQVGAQVRRGRWGWGGRGWGRGRARIRRASCSASDDWWPPDGDDASPWTTASLPWRALDQPHVQRCPAGPGTPSRCRWESCTPPTREAGAASREAGRSRCTRPSSRQARGKAADTVPLNGPKPDGHGSNPLHLPPPHCHTSPGDAILLIQCTCCCALMRCGGSIVEGGALHGWPSPRQWSPPRQTAHANADAHRCITAHL